MEPVVYLAAYDLIVCCGQGRIANEIASHLRTAHKAISKGGRQAIMEEINRIPGLIQTYEELTHRFRLPQTATEMITELGQPQENGLRCCECAYISTAIRRMQEHCRDAHGWQNDRGRGRITKADEALERMVGGRAVPWTAGIRCQRFFKGRVASGWFEVQAAAVAATVETIAQGLEQLQKRMEKASQDQAARFAAAELTADIIEASQKDEPNLWLRRVGWVAHLQGISGIRLAKSIRSIGGSGDTTGHAAQQGRGRGRRLELELEPEPEPERAVELAAEPVLQEIWASFERVVKAARLTATQNGAGHAALFEINRKEGYIKPKKPFRSEVEERTWDRYIEVWRKIFCFIVRTVVWKDDDIINKNLPPYTLTKQQTEYFIRLEGAARAVAAGRERLDRLDRLCLDFAISLLDHPLRHSHYESVLLSALAVLGFRFEDEGWKTAKIYTPVYAAVVKVARMLVLQQSYAEQQDEVRQKVAAAVRNGEELDENEARQDSSSLFELTRPKVQRFMVRLTETGQPTPIDWIWDAWAYGLKISMAEVGQGCIDWQGGRISYQKIRFTMDELSDMLHGLVAEMQQDMAQLLLMQGRGRDELPRIPWAELEDDISEDRVGYSFLTDDRNQRWVEGGHNFVLRRILASEGRRATWLGPGASVEAGSRAASRAVSRAASRAGTQAASRAGSQAGSQAASRARQEELYRYDTIRAYGDIVERFREKLLILMHLTGGQPARAPELLGLRFKNTAYGSIRNIFVHSRHVCFVTLYHKGLNITDHTKVIYRYLPREAGELLVWYLWLVLPFWQQIAGIVKNADEASAFLWADEIVRRRRRQQPHQLASSASSEATETAEAIEALEAAEAAEAAEVAEAAEAAEAEADRALEATWRRLLGERKWTSDRMRRTLQGICMRYLGVPMTIAAWRHIIIAISRRFLQGKINSPEAGGYLDENGDYIEEDDSEEDSIWNLQSAHGSKIAGIIYGRLIQQGAIGLAGQQEQFRRISRQWHRFLGLGLEDVAAGRKRRLEEYDVARDDARRRRLQRLYEADLAGSLRQLLGNDSAQFRSGQEKVLAAVVRGVSPILQIAGTGGGKSITFMLPAFRSPDGVTIVVTPLVALQVDLLQRCKAAQIDTHIWTSGGGGGGYEGSEGGGDIATANRAASIVLVTPESAVSKAFANFLNRLRGRQQLDRIVLDECHMLLDSRDEFRPRMQELGGLLSELGVQQIFLTATLAPQDEEAFYRIAAIRRQDIVAFRDRTSRPNIQYRVIYGGGGGGSSSGSIEIAVVREVKRALERIGKSGKIIVYCQRIEQTQRLAAELQCAAFYSSVDTAEGKARRLRVWIESGQVIVATNSLGAGIDIPDIRVVVHAGAPQQLRDYAQQSGRAGRDGQAAEAVIVLQGRPGQLQRQAKAGLGERAGKKLSERAGKKQGERRDGGREQHEDMDEFLSGQSCRRVVLDRILDGRKDRLGCEDGEEACDICEKQRLEEAFEALERQDEEEAGRAAASGQAGPIQGIWASEWRRRQARQREIADEGGQVAEFRRQVEDWEGSCVVCRIQQPQRRRQLVQGNSGGGSGHSVQHELEWCVEAGTARWVAIRNLADELRKEIFGARRLARYSGCFSCGIPQSWCSSWVAEEADGGRFRRARAGAEGGGGGNGWNCQYRGLLIEVVAAAWIERNDMARQVLGELMVGAKDQGEGVISPAARHVAARLGERVCWGGLETNRLCQVFSEIVRRLN